MEDRAPHVVPELLEGLRALGLRPGQCVIMHSSFKSLGIAATPADVIHTLVELLGPDGTLMAPTFTYSYAGIWQVEPFDPATTPGWGNGVLTETLRAHPGALRSAHPTYSVAALGRQAPRITEGKGLASALGAGSSYDEAHALGAHILLLGVGNNRNSSIHYAEVVAGLPYSDIPFREFWTRTALVVRDGASAEVPLASEFPACSANFGRADEYLIERGIIRRAAVCQAPSMYMPMAEMVAAVVERLRAEPSWLLCDNIVCEPCTLRKRRLAQRGLL
jgi:aminoglycoside 3-N-acetyltransferase